MPSSEGLASEDGGLSVGVAREVEVIVEPFPILVIDVVIVPRVVVAAGIADTVATVTPRVAGAVMLVSIVAALVVVDVTTVIVTIEVEAAAALVVVDVVVIVVTNPVAALAAVRRVVASVDVDAAPVVVIVGAVVIIGAGAATVVVVVIVGEDDHADAAAVTKIVTVEVVIVVVVALVDVDAVTVSVAVARVGSGIGSVWVGIAADEESEDDPADVGEEIGEWSIAVIEDGATEPGELDVAGVALETAGPEASSVGNGTSVLGLSPGSKRRNISAQLLVVKGQCMMALHTGSVTKNGTSQL